jgi:cytochrome b
VDADRPTAETAGGPPAPSLQKVWDAPTRITHWSLVILIGLSWWSAENGQMAIHYWSGLTTVGLLAFRIYWGFAGPETARFARFVRGPRAVAAYVRGLFRQEHRAVFGHSPLGALSVLAMLLAIGLQAGMGVFASDTSYVSSGPLSHLVDYDMSEAITELHEDFFNVLLALIGLHLAAILFYLIVKRANLIGPMITGHRRTIDAEGPPQGIAPVSWLRLAIGTGLAAGLVWLLAS